MKFSTISILVILLSSHWAAAIAEAESTGEASSIDPTGSVNEDKIHEGVDPAESYGLLGKTYGSLAEAGDITERNLQTCDEIGPTQWGTYHWNTCTVDVMVETVLDDIWSPLFNNALDDWNQAANIQLRMRDPIEEYSSGAARWCFPQFGRMRVCNYMYGATGWLGVAQIWINSSGHITSGVVMLNDSYFQLQQFDTDEWRAMVMCQEIGHLIGLGHWDVNFATNCPSCMDYSNDPFGEPDPRDLDLLDTIYDNHCERRRLREHVDDHSNPSEHADDHPNPSEHADDHPTPPEEETMDDDDWGHLVESNSHSSTYETEPDEHGNQMVTEVLWAE